MCTENIYHKRLRQREWVASRRRDYIIRRGGCCENCESTLNLEFHHRNPEEKITHKIFSRTAVFIEAELAKCELLCRSCHRKSSVHKHKPMRHIHGTTTEYRRGCRCTDCWEAKQRYMECYRRGPGSRNKLRTYEAK
jgi:hypothetical protein